MIDNIECLYDQGTNHSTLIIQDGGRKYNIVIENNIIFDSPLFFANAAMYYFKNKMPVARNIAKLYMYNFLLKERVWGWMLDDISTISRHLPEYKTKYYKCVLNQFKNLLRNRTTHIKL